MDIIGLIKSALQALTQYLELKNRAFFYDINEKSKKRQEDIRNEIEKLRKSPNSNDQYRADILRAVLQEERDYFNNISTYYTLSGKG
jgi:thiamine pyrophosphate-dependent acetolactate synthase large subunit-like protein